ncbi:TPA: glycosyltransferase family 2 protein [Streptococcus agalactiae]|uniref:glycosyltransferase family 2 protein n=1 Tax=Streptococcus TaxID=1301 RepID=UPI0003906B0D|nr:MULTISPECIES: glycosyltransferase family A protein [Streptococcus]AGU79784.1 glycosyl transferase family protein [Streptococcus constellatus subsp. pharyngis C1050]EUC75556.1 glycosyltransferase-like protein, family 2 domain protein [Streptococcus sp. CM7]MCW1080555.1 glycosyltransferase family 2 protein [Streptococcus anginosus]MCW1088601.1 glycosyltransferase family 2 protein [Streptococcus anginosus]MDX5092761.1 glycosyltransferase family A protein [Streptococcus anginosus]
MDGISIIIPCFNSGYFVVDAVESIKSLNIQISYEIIIVDDCSTDMETKKILTRMRNDSAIKIYRNSRNRGVQYSRNKGLKKSNFNYILPLDADDCLNSNCYFTKEESIIDYSVRILKNNPDVALVQTMSEMFGDFCGYTISSYPTSEWLAVHRHHVPTSIIYRREDGLKTLYDAEILKWQDWSFGVSLMNQRIKEHKKNIIYFIPKPLHLYRVYNSHNRISSKLIDEKEVIYKTILRNTEIFRKYFGDIDIKQITQLVYNSSPSRLEELMYVAKFDIRIAKEIIQQRNYNLASSLVGETVP